MNKNEATLLLNNCRYLAGKLAVHGVEVELTERDKMMLRDFDIVSQAGFLDNSSFYLEIDFSHDDIARLKAKVEKEFPRRKIPHFKKPEK